MSTQKKPNFFIAGVSKCGTTAMSEYLRSHPNIFMCTPKEPHYFAEDFPGIRCVKNLSQYLELYQEANSQHLVIGEASATYLYSIVAIQRIHEFNSNAKILVMLRNPLDMVYSLHSEFLYNGNEIEEDFNKAWELQKTRSQGLKIPPVCLEPKLLIYRDYARYSLQLKRLFGFFPSEQVKIVLFDDFITYTEKIYLEVLQFLELPFDNRYDFPKINANKKCKSKPLNIILSYINQYTNAWHPITRKVKKMIGIQDISFLRLLRAKNTQESNRKPLNPTIRNKLIKVFRQDIEELSQILNRDLTYWIKD